jgi:hypothetical protein
LRQGVRHSHTWALCVDLIFTMYNMFQVLSQKHYRKGELLAAHTQKNRLF